MVFISFPPEI